ncbi:MAG: hypothetical protein H5T80_00875 [Dietzia sp.]|nr:hypothetical protein [Dietzia sp.]
MIKDLDDPVPQVRAALGEVRRQWPDAPVVLVGASMGGRQTVRADAARALAEATSSEFVSAESGHGWDLVVEEGRLSPLGQQIVAYASR